jgi:glycosyltransferase involved in cell wall biosynthesis
MTHHIGIDARLNAYRVGGISTYTRQLILALERLQPGEHFTVFQSRKATTPLADRFPEHRLWTPPHHRLERLTLSVELSPYWLDVLHSPDFVPPLRGARRHVITVHDLTFLHFPQHKDAASIRYYSNQIRAAVHHADHILSVSEATRRDLIDMLAVPAEKITVQPHGVDRRFRPLPQAQTVSRLIELNLPSRYMLFVGTLEPRKNIPALLDAFIELKSDLPLVLVGQAGWNCEAIIERVQTTPEVIWRSDIGDDDLPVIYNGAAALVLPTFYEGFGMPLLEAMACGTPVIGSDNSAIPEVMGDAGWLIDPHDTETIVAALEQALNLGHRSQRGPEQAAQFTWEKSARIALSVYRALH